MAKNKIKAYSTNVLDYSSTMSMWEKESLAAEAKLGSERKSKKKPFAKKAHFHDNVQRFKKPSPQTRA